MKFILDAHLSPRLSVELNAAGCETQHVTELGLLQASDIEIIYEESSLSNQAIFDDGLYRYQMI